MSRHGRSVADQLRARVPKLAGLMDNAEADVLAFTTFPKERLNGERCWYKSVCGQVIEKTRELFADRGLFRSSP